MFDFRWFSQYARIPKLHPPRQKRPKITKHTQAFSSTPRPGAEDVNKHNSAADRDAPENPDEAGRCFDIFTQIEECFSIRTEMDPCIYIDTYSSSDPNISSTSPMFGTFPTPDIDRDGKMWKFAAGLGMSIQNSTTVKFFAFYYHGDLDGVHESRVFALEYIQHVTGLFSGPTILTTLDTSGTYVRDVQSITETTNYYIYNTADNKFTLYDKFFNRIKTVSVNFNLVTLMESDEPDIFYTDIGDQSVYSINLQTEEVREWGIDQRPAIPPPPWYAGEPTVVYLPYPFKHGRNVLWPGKGWTPPTLFYGPWVFCRDISTTYDGIAFARYGKGNQTVTDEACYAGGLHRFTNLAYTLINTSEVTITRDLHAFVGDTCGPGRDISQDCSDAKVFANGVRCFSGYGRHIWYLAGPKGDEIRPLPV